ncbi:hypothetical protein ACJRO7_026951 [Eucalyptus globulus]|uniref:Uncharacterized protein n=1 Tax=Eucalyptus globulus TaxID=34317 RepID=A0ABD3JTH5_EUCGL
MDFTTRKASSAKSSYIVCEECAEERERGEGPSAFHCCPCDTVVVGFRTKAGPISRPSKSQGDTSDQAKNVELRTKVGPISRPSESQCGTSDQVKAVQLRTGAGLISRPSESQCGTSNQVKVVALRTEAGPISRPSPIKPNPSPSAAERTGWTPWDWSCLCVHARLGMPTCGCYNRPRNSVMSIWKPY